MPKLVAEGWWEQEGFGRQPMNGLIIDFVNGQLFGTGEDIVGQFEMSGTLNGEAIFIRKQYIRKHAIDYHGIGDGEGSYFGDWSVYGHVGGRWSLRIKASLSDDLSAIRRLEPS
jgi:hypothetical protein